MVKVKEKRKQRKGKMHVKDKQGNTHHKPFIKIKV